MTCGYCHFQLAWMYSLSDEWVNNTPLFVHTIIAATNLYIGPVHAFHQVCHPCRHFKRLLWCLFESLHVQCREYTEWWRLVLPLTEYMASIAPWIPRILESTAPIMLSFLIVYGKRPHHASTLFAITCLMSIVFHSYCLIPSYLENNNNKKEKKRWRARLR